MSTREQIESLIEIYGVEHIVYPLKMWEVLEVMDENGYINLESLIEANNLEDE